MVRAVDKADAMLTLFKRSTPCLGNNICIISEATLAWVVRSLQPQRHRLIYSKDYGGKDLWKRCVLSLEWKADGVIDGESEGDDCDEVTCEGWGEPGAEWTEWGWRNEEGSWFHRWGDAYLKERLVICDEEYTDGRAMVTVDEERVLHCVSKNAPTLKRYSSKL